MKNRLRKKKHLREYAECGRQVVIARTRKDDFAAYQIGPQFDLWYGDCPDMAAHTQAGARLVEEVP